MLPAFGSPWFLLLGLLVPWAVWLARRSDTGLSRVRRAFSIGLRVLVLLLLILALSGLRS